MTLVEKLVRHYSPSGQEENAVLPFLQEMKERGFTASKDEAGNAIGVIGSGPVHIYLVGHIDTVPGEIPVRVENNILYGRGSVDAKAPLATFVEAASHFKESETLTITVIGCVAEETDSRGAKAIFNNVSAPDFVIIGEPSSWNGITIGYRGSIPLNYSLTIPNYHMGAPTSRPAEQAVEFYQQLCDSYPDRGNNFDRISLTLAKINTATDGLHDSVNMYLDIRTPVGFDLSTFEQTINTIKKSADVHLDTNMPAVLADKKNPLVRALMGSIRRQDGKPIFKRKTGTSDMNILKAWDCPIVAYGPGDSALDHTPDEHLDLNEYNRTIEILHHTLSRLQAEQHAN